MRASDLLFTATSSIGRNKSRSVLTILGIVIGIASVILMLSIGQSAQGIILGQVANLGSDLLFIEASSGAATNGPPSAFVKQTLTLKDAKALEKSGFFSAVSPTAISSLPVKYQEEAVFASVNGVNESYLTVFPADVATGRFLDATDVDGGARVAVLGKGIAHDLFGDVDPLDRQIDINGTSFRVVGVMAEQGSRFFQNLDDQLAVPVTTMQRNLLGTDTVNFISMKVALGKDVATTQDEARWIMRDQHDIQNPSGDLTKDDFTVSSQSDAVASVSVIGSILTLLLSSIAAISLVVGGVGIMNIMLVSVSERTKEIGLRKAVGATEGEILRQFLYESIILTMSGGLVGVTLGVGMALGAALVVSKFVDGWVAIIPPIALVLGVAVSTIIGLVFGVYPARRAARLDPIEALRYE